VSEAIFNFHDTLLLATAFQSLLFVVLMSVGNRDPHLSDYFLVGFFIAQIAIPIHLLISYGEEFRLIALEFSPNLFRIFDFAYWLEGPLLLWYTRSLLFKDFALKRRDVLLLAPAILYLLFTVVTFYSWDDAAKVQYIQDYQTLIAPSLPHALEALREVLFVAFGVLCLREILHAQQQIHQRYSDIPKNDIVWLGLLVVAFMVLRVWTLLVVGLAFLQPDLGSDVFNTMGLVGNYFMFIMISTLIYFSLTRSSLFAGKIDKSHVHVGNEDIKVDPELTHKIEQHMQNQKPYLSHFLNLEELAKQLAMHPRALSVAIRQNFKTNFYEFINSYRIDEAKRLLTDEHNSERTILEILGDAGFNSKATFNAFFKKLVGVTPSQYRQGKQQVNSS